MKQNGREIRRLGELIPSGILNLVATSEIEAMNDLKKRQDLVDHSRAEELQGKKICGVIQEVSADEPIGEGRETLKIRVIENWKVAEDEAREPKVAGKLDEIWKKNGKNLKNRPMQSQKSAYYFATIMIAQKKESACDWFTYHL